MPTYIEGQIKDISGTTEISLEGSTVPYGGYCFVYENPNLEFNVTIGIVPPTFAEFIKQSYYIPKAIKELGDAGALEHIKVCGFKFLCTEYITLPMSIGVWDVIMRGFRMEVFVKDKGAAIQFGVIYAAIAIGIIIISAVGAFKLFQFTTTEAADLINDLAEKTSNTIVLMALVAFGLLAAVLLIGGGEFGVSRQGAKVTTKGAKLPSLGKK